MVQRSSTTVAAVVADVGCNGHGLMRYDLPGGVSVSFLFDGNPDRPRSCQWRVAAAEEPVLRSAVSELLAELVGAGIGHDRPRYSNGFCHFEDFGAWPVPVFLEAKEVEIPPTGNPPA